MIDQSRTTTGNGAPEPLSQWDAAGRAVMIDDPATRDLDDALFVTESPNGGWTATVHIAATAATITPETPTDRHARSRIQSKYLRNKTIPMLGQAAEQQATLSETHDRPALTVAMTFDRTATLTTASVTRNQLPAGSCVRLAYGSVPTILEDPTHPLHHTMAASQHLAKALLARRTAAGALVLYDLIRGYALTEDGTIARIPTQQRTVGYVIVAELMIAASAALAEWCIDEDLTILFRNHRTRLLGGDGTELATDIAASLHDPELFEQLRSRVHRTFGRAQYATTPRGHHGLRVAAYAHVTSPLRRYADLVSQRNIWDHLAGEPPSYDRATLDEIATEINIAADTQKRSTEAHFKHQSRKEGAQHILNGDYANLDQKQWRKMFDLMTKTAPAAGIEAELNRRLSDDQLSPNDLARVATAGPAWIHIRKRLFRAARHKHPEFGPSIVSGRAQLLGEPQPETEVLLAPDRPVHIPLFAIRARVGDNLGAWQIRETKKAAHTQAMWELLDILCEHTTPHDQPPAWPSAGATNQPTDIPTTEHRQITTTLPDTALRHLASLTSGKRSNAFANPVGWLTSFATTQDLGTVEYHYDTRGPSHEPLFTCTARIADLHSAATSPAKKQARVATATRLITALFAAADDLPKPGAEGHPQASDEPST